jgi:hypothetical protein
VVRWLVQPALHLLEVTAQPLRARQATPAIQGQALPASAKS